MEIHLNPEVQAKLDQIAHDTGRPGDQLVEEALIGYFDALAHTRQMLDSRYDDLESGRVKPIDGEAFFESLRLREEEMKKPTAQ
jgi:predicted transcriptional regulator